jgi:hypothetical protein
MKDEPIWNLDQIVILDAIRTLDQIEIVAQG